jgi:hypothetical protein
LFLGTGCMVPQPYAAGGNRSYPGVLGHNQRPTVPGVNYPDTATLCIHNLIRENDALDEDFQ